MYLAYHKLLGLPINIELGNHIELANHIELGINICIMYANEKIL